MGTTFHSVTIKGSSHRRNEDSLLAGELPGGWTAMGVFDGITSLGHGDAASAAARRAVEAGMETGWDTDCDKRGFLLELMQKAHAAVRKLASCGEPAGTTATVCLLDTATGDLHTAHVGDSPAYRLHGEDLYPLTIDDACLDSFSGRSILTKHLGRDGELDLSTVYSRCTLKDGDRLLVCTDGLSGPLAGQMGLFRHLAGDFSVEESARQLAAYSSEHGNDDVTLILTEVHTQAAPETAGTKAGEAGKETEPTFASHPATGIGLAAAWSFFVGTLAGILIGAAIFRGVPQGATCPEDGGTPQSSDTAMKTTIITSETLNTLSHENEF